MKLGLSFCSLLSLLTLLLNSVAETQWLQTSGPPEGTVRCLLLNGADLYAGTRMGVFRSKDGGAHWDSASTGLGNPAVWALLATGNKLFAGTNGGGLFRSADSGRTWVAVNLGILSMNVYCLDTVGTSLFVGTGQGGIFRSTDYGDHWVPADSSILPSSGVISLTSMGQTLYAGLDGAGVFRSSDLGVTWSMASTGLSNTNVWNFAQGGNQLFAGTMGGGVFHSSDGGSSWIKFKTGLTDTVVYSMAAKGTKIFAGTYREGVFLSMDGGSNWTDASLGLTNLYVRSLCVSDSFLFAGTYGNGVWKRPITELISSIGHVASRGPTSCELEQNYPNPFNPSTVIQYILNDKTYVRLTVWNIMGERVATLVEGDQQAGSHVVRFEGTSLASSVYYYKLQAGGTTIVRRMVLLR
jgi:photosystem II stability/assembly factor-like uncharacterized protein